VTICCLLAGCAGHPGVIGSLEIRSPSSKTVSKQVEPVSDKDKYEQLIKSLKDFQIEILSENHGVCPGPDGKNMIFLGRDARFRLILTFPQSLPDDIKPADLQAQIAHLQFSFAKKISKREYQTEIIQLSSVAPDIQIGPSGISIIYKGKAGIINIGTQRMLAIDTTAPIKPINLRITNKTENGFTLAWDFNSEDIKEFCVQKFAFGKWLTIRSGFKSPHISIDLKPEDRIRIVAVDCSINRSFSEEISLEQGIHSITKIGRGKKKYLAYRAAQILIDAGFVKDYIAPWLESNASLKNKDFRSTITEHFQGRVPPGIKYTPEKKAKYYKEDDMWCAEVTGSIDKYKFLNWISEKADSLKKIKSTTRK